MPTYVFRCQEHGDFDVKQGMMEEHRAVCPRCKLPAQRIYFPTMHYWPDVLFDKHGKKQSVDNLPSVPSGTRYTHGWTPNKEG